MGKKSDRNIRKFCVGMAEAILSRKEGEITADELVGFADRLNRYVFFGERSSDAEV